MKVKVHIDQVISVNVGMDQVINTIKEMEPAQGVMETLSLLDACICAIKLVPKTMIAALTEEQRNMVHNALKEEMPRYSSDAGKIILLPH